MEAKVVGFIPPVIGVETSFNTFRLGVSYAKSLKVGDEVFLLNEKDRLVFGRATVDSLEIGSLGEMCLIHGHKNHTELRNDSTAAPERLFKTIQKIYGPHIALPEKKTTVIYLTRIE